MRYLYTIILLLCAASVSAQQPALRALSVDPAHYSGQLKIMVVELAEQDDELFMDIKVSMDRDVMNRRLSYLLIPELKTEENAVTGTGFLVNGQIRDKIYRRKLSFGNQYLLDNRPHIKTEVTNHADTLIRYTLRMPYELWMDSASLDIHQILVSPTGKEQLYTLAGAGKVKLLPRVPYAVSPLVNLITPEPVVKTRQMQGKAYLDFQVGRPVILPKFRRNPEELAKIDATIIDVKDNPDVEINSIFVEGYASPEGSYASNTKLAQARSEALAAYISKTYGISSQIIRASSVPEDWAGLRQQVERSDLVRRDEILAVIDSEDDPDRKEQRLRRMGWPWTAMLNNMFPSLRRVEYRIDYTIKDYSLEEAEKIMEKNPEQLNQYELFILAQSYPEQSPAWTYVTETTVRLFPDDPITNLNAAAALLKRGDAHGAKPFLDKAADVPGAANNLGVYYLMTGDLDTAETYLRQAAAGGSQEAEHNLTELETKRENNRLMERYNL